MSGSLEESLSRFTPHAADLDRDALLFAAGRASVRPNRRWQTLAGVLAASQLFTLVCLWPRTTPPIPAPDAKSYVASEPMPGPAPKPDPSALQVLRQRMLESDFDYPSPASDEPMVPPDPPLRAFANPPPSLLN